MQRGERPKETAANLCEGGGGAIVPPHTHYQALEAFTAAKVGAFRGKEYLGRSQRRAKTEQEEEERAERGEYLSRHLI